MEWMSFCLASNAIIKIYLSCTNYFKEKFYPVFSNQFRKEIEKKLKNEHNDRRELDFLTGNV